jgi:hypothetical protein
MPEPHACKILCSAMQRFDFLPQNAHCFFQWPATSDQIKQKRHNRCVHEEKEGVDLACVKP